jgi:hypothetical protein
VNSLVIGKNSAVGMSLQLHKNSDNYLFLDRNQSESLLTEILEFQRFLEQNDIHKIVYLMVDRTTKVSEITESKINYTFPFRIAQAISKFEDVSFIWPSSIFCEDQSMVEKHPYLSSQNLAFELIRDVNSRNSENIGRIFFPQIYGGETYRKHQPFLYKVRDLIRAQDDVFLTNGKAVFRNFIHEYDVSRVLADSRSWINEIEVKCLFEESMSWLEIAEIIKESYNSGSQIHDQTSHPIVIPEYKYFSGNTLNISKQYNLISLKTAIETELF